MRRRGRMRSRCAGRWALGALAAFLVCANLPAQSDSPRRASSSSARSTPKKFSASAIQIEPVDTSQVALPPEFRVAVYENLIQEVSKTGKFQQVLRSGDRAAAGVPDLVILRTKVEEFKPGSQRQREVTTVSGATSVKLLVQVSSREGKVLLSREVVGKVRFFGQNLRATHDFSKKAAAILSQSF